MSQSTQNVLRSLAINGPAAKCHSMLTDVDASRFVIDPIMSVINDRACRMDSVMDTELPNTTVNASTRAKIRLIVNSATRTAMSGVIASATTNRIRRNGQQVQSHFHLSRTLTKNWRKNFNRKLISL